MRGALQGQSALGTWPAALWLTLAALVAVACDDQNGSAPDGSAVPVDTTPNGPVAFRVATWNVENFFDEGDDPEREDDVRTRSQVEGKMAGIAEVLAEIDADFVALQEVENESLLQRLAEGPAAELGYVAWGLEDAFDGRGLDVGFLSRLEPSNVVSHIGESFMSADGTDTYYFARDALEVFVAPGGYVVTVMVLHFRSMLDGGDDHRLAEARQAREIVERRLAIGTERIMVVGDLNDFPGSATLDALLEGSTLVDLTREVPMAERYSYVFRGARQQLDYQLGNAAIDASHVETRFVRSAAADAVSDHDPVVVDLMIQP